KNGTDVVVQKSRKRQIDSLIYKYVGVTGVDKPRIVEVGYRTDSLLANLVWKNLALAAAVAGLLLASGVLAYVMLRRTVTAPLDKLVRASKAAELEEYRLGALDDVRFAGTKWVTWLPRLRTWWLSSLAVTRNWSTSCVQP